MIDESIFVLEVFSEKRRLSRPQLEEMAERNLAYYPSLHLVSEDGGKTIVDGTDKLISDLLDPSGRSCKDVASFLAESHADWIEEHLGEDALEQATNQPEAFLEAHGKVIAQALKKALLAHFSGLTLTFSFEKNSPPIRGTFYATEQVLRKIHGKHGRTGRFSTSDAVEIAKALFEQEARKAFSLLNGVQYRIVLSEVENPFAEKAAWDSFSEHEMMAHVITLALRYGPDTIMFYNECEEEPYLCDTKTFLVGLYPPYRAGAALWRKMVSMGVELGNAYSHFNFALPELEKLPSFYDAKDAKLHRNLLFLYEFFKNCVERSITSALKAKDRSRSSQAFSPDFSLADHLNDLHSIKELAASSIESLNLLKRSLKDGQISEKPGFHLSKSLKHIENAIEETRSMAEKVCLV